MADKVRVALMGAGGMGMNVHLPCLASLPDVELAGVCDVVEEKAVAAAAQFGIPSSFTDYHEMLAAVDPQVVYAALRPQDLFEPSAAILQQGRHLFVEKPLAMTAKQAQMLAYIAAEHSCLTAVGFQRRHIPALTALKPRVEEQGPIHQATVSFLKGGQHFPFDKHAGLYGAVIDNLTVDGVHAVDNLRFLCGGEVVSVAAHVRARYVPGPMPNEFTALISFSTGAVGILQSSYATRIGVFRAEFHGRNVTGYVDANGQSFLRGGREKSEVYESKEFGTAGGAAGDSHLHWTGFWHENRHFIDCVREGRQPLTHFADAAKSMELVEQIHQAGSR